MNKVPAKWTPEARRLFRELHAHMGDQHSYTHPQAPQLSRAQWETTRWNAAWMAAEMLSSGARARDIEVVTE